MARLTIAVLIMLAASYVSAGASPKEAASAWAQEMGLHVDGVVCAGSDSDGDGYVSCDINAGDGRIVRVACAAPNGLGHDSSGCTVHTEGCKSKGVQ